MNYAISLLLIFFPILSLNFTVPAFAGNVNSTSNSTHILLSCGTSGTSKDDVNNLTWIGDSTTNYISKTPSQVSTIPYQNPSVPEVPYSNARIFTSSYIYNFPLSPGRYFLRLHFYPANYSNLFISDSYMTVTAGPYTLLSNFSAWITLTAMNYDYLVREFSINITTATLTLTFAPSTKHPNAFAFINGIEIVSSPDLFTLSTAYYGDGTPNTHFSYDPGMAFQTMFRLNVGGRALDPYQDSGNLYRSWDDDSGYIYGAAYGVTFQNDSNVTIEYPSTVPQYIAPVSVYETARSMGPNAAVNLLFNLTWILKVDAGFYYLLRFHFCEIKYPITMPKQRVFFIYINNQTAQSGFDVIALSGGIGIPIYRDYVVATVGSGQMDMWIALYPDLDGTDTEYYDAILNGLEVFKMSMADNNLAGLNPVPSQQNIMNPTKAFSDKPKWSKGKVTAIIVGGVAAGVLLLSFVSCMFIFYRGQKRKDKFSAGTKSEEEEEEERKTSEDANLLTIPSKLTDTGSGKDSYPSSLPANLCRHFLYNEIFAATNGFDEALVIGFGGFGNVYRAEIDSGSTKVAIKRGNTLSGQGIREFETEIELLSKLRHRHLVSLIGYCDENNEMILVYDYMAHGTLREHLCNSRNTPLTWRQRLEICIGAARGLHYLHTVGFRISKLSVI